jgi:hypothetical protein
MAMQFPSKELVEMVRRIYPAGARVELIEMHDPHTSLKPGDRGFVEMVDSTGTVFCKWDNGSTLGAVYGVDKIRTVDVAVPDEVVEDILKLRTLPNCPNMFDTIAVQRLAYENEMYSLVTFLETDKKAYSAFIISGERGVKPCK